jgi:hypothetical protein
MSEKTNDDDCKVIVEFAPGTMTAEKAIAIGQAWLDALNANANDLHAGIGELFRFKNMEWIDDGKDTLTLSILVAPSTGGAEEEQG